MSKSFAQKVVFVDLLPAAELERKAPELWTWMNTQQFIHVQESGADFLDDLRRRFGAQFRDQLLEYPQYTRPPEFRGQRVPDVLLRGDHAAIARWRRREALRRTQRGRPDLLSRAELSEEDRRLLAETADDRED